jgi:hypothetical protein
MSLSVYVIDAIVISGLMLDTFLDTMGSRGESVAEWSDYSGFEVVPASSIWETP